MKAMIFAAGLGTRLKPITDSMPKALVPVCGKPLLHHVMEKLESAGFNDITVNVHHFAGQIIDYLADRCNGNAASSHISDESDLLRETGGGIAHARQFLDGDEAFLVHNVDILSNLDLKAFASSHKSDALATLVVSERSTSRYLLFDNDMRLVGWTNVKTGEVKSPFPGLDPEQCSKLAFSGIHMMSPDVFPLMADPATFGTKTVPERFSIIDFYLAVASKQTIYGYIPEDFRMMDVGKLDSLKEAEEFIQTL